MKKSSSITTDVIERVAELARLYFKKEELEKFRSQLESVFGYFEKVSLVQTSKIKQTSHTLKIENRFREDIVEKERILGQKEALSQAKKTYKGYFLVKSVFDD